MTGAYRQCTRKTTCFILPQVWQRATHRLGLLASGRHYNSNDLAIIVPCWKKHKNWRKRMRWGHVPCCCYSFPMVNPPMCVTALVVSRIWAMSTRRQRRRLFRWINRQCITLMRNDDATLIYYYSCFTIQVLRGPLGSAPVTTTATTDKNTMTMTSNNETNTTTGNMTTTTDKNETAPTNRYATDWYGYDCHCTHCLSHLKKNGVLAGIFCTLDRHCTSQCLLHSSILQWRAIDILPRLMHIARRRKRWHRNRRD